MVEVAQVMVVRRMHQADSKDLETSNKDTEKFLVQFFYPLATSIFVHKYPWPPFLLLNKPYIPLKELERTHLASQLSLQLQKMLEKRKKNQIQPSPFR